MHHGQVPEAGDELQGSVWVARGRDLHQGSGQGQGWGACTAALCREWGMCTTAQCKGFVMCATAQAKGWGTLTMAQCR